MWRGGRSGRIRVDEPRPPAPVPTLARNRRRLPPERGRRAERPGGGDPGVRRQPRSRRGARAPVLALARRPARGSRDRDAPRQPRARRGGARRGARGRRPRVRRPRRRRRGRGQRPTRDRAPRCHGAGGGRVDGRAELHGRRRPRRGLDLDRAAAGDHGRRSCRAALPVRVDGRRVPVARRPDRRPLRRLARRRGRDRRRRLPRVPRGGRGDARDRPLPRDGAAAGGLRRRSGTVRRGGQARGVPEGRPLGGGGPCRALAHRRARRLGSRVLRRLRRYHGASRCTTSTS